MLAAIVGLLLILTIAIGFLGLIAAPQLRSGSRILTPEAERAVKKGAAAPAAAGRGTVRGLIASWRASIATAQWFQRIWHPVSEAMHSALDRLEDRETPASRPNEKASRESAVGAADLTARMGHAQPRGHTRSAVTEGGRTHPASAWLGKTGEIPIRDIAVPTDPEGADDGDRPFAASEITRPIAPIPGAVPATAAARSSTRGPLAPLSPARGVSSPGVAAIAAPASPKKTDAKKSVRQHEPQPAAAKVKTDAPAARTGGQPPAGRGTTPGSASTAAPAAVARATSDGGSGTGQGGVRHTSTPAKPVDKPKGPRRDRFDVAAIIGTRGRGRQEAAAKEAAEKALREAAAAKAEREAAVKAEREAAAKAGQEAKTKQAAASEAAQAPVDPADETVMIAPVKEQVASAPGAKGEPQVTSVGSSVDPADETVMIAPVKEEIASAPGAKGEPQVTPAGSSVDPADETVMIAPVKEPVVKSGPAKADEKKDAAAQGAPKGSTADKAAPAGSPTSARVTKAQPASADATVDPSDETVMILPVTPEEEPASPADETVMIAPVKEPVLRQTPEPEAESSGAQSSVDVDPSEDTVIAPVKAPAVEPSDEARPYNADEVMIMAAVREPVARTDKKAAEPAKAVAEKATADGAAAEENVTDATAESDEAQPERENQAVTGQASLGEKSAEKSAEAASDDEVAAAGPAAETELMQPVAADGKPVAETELMQPIAAPGSAAETELMEPVRDPAAAETVVMQPVGEATGATGADETVVLEAIDEPVAEGQSPGNPRAKGRSRGKKTRGGKVRNGR